MQPHGPYVLPEDVVRRMYDGGSDGFTKDIIAASPVIAPVAKPSIADVPKSKPFDSHSDEG